MWFSISKSLNTIMANYHSVVLSFLLLPVLDNIYHRVMYNTVCHIVSRTSLLSFLSLVPVNVRLKNDGYDIK